MREAGRKERSEGNVRREERKSNRRRGGREAEEK